MVKIKKLHPRYFSKLFSYKTIENIRKQLCGELVGKGLYRDVYVMKSNPDYVIKIERKASSDGIFANVAEWLNYMNNKEWTWLEEWLAPCELISPDGRVLIQRRVTWEGKKRKDCPKYVPKMLTDTKFANWGWIGDRFVCCDYSFMITVVYSKTMSPRPMKRVKWHRA